MFSKRKCFPMMCFLNQREGLTNDLPPIPISGGGAPVEATTDTISQNTAAISSLTSGFQALIARLNSLGGTVSSNKSKSAANRPDYDLLGCRATTAELKLEAEEA